MRQPLRILSIEDDPKDTGLITDLLETQGIVCDVTRVDTQAAVLACLEQRGIDLILADYSLPSFDGISALKFAMNACPDVPFIFVSGTLGEEVAIEALKIGATDYVLKTRLSRLVPAVLRSLREAEQKAERKRTEESLRRSETYLAEAQRLSHAGSFGWKPSTGEIIWSEETFRIFQYDTNVTPTLDLAVQRVHPEDVPLWKQTIDRAPQDGTHYEHEYRLLVPDGPVKHVRVVARAVSDESGSLEFVGTVMDVTVARQTEETLRKSETYLAEAQRLSHTGSWARNLSTGDVFFSRESYRMFGFDPEKKITRELIVGRVHPEDRAASAGVIDKAIQEVGDFEMDYRIVLDDGSIRHIHCVGHPVRRAGIPVEFVGTIMDVTERKQAEALREGERHILEMIARDAPLSEILDKLVRVVEAQFAGLLCSVVLLDEDGQHVRRGAGPSLPKAYTDAIDGLRIGPKAGSCGTAMYRKEPVVVSDILRDPLWEPYRALAERYGLRACWSTPILNSGKVLGSFAMYYREPRTPNPSETRALELSTHLAGIAIERKLAHERLQRSEAYLAESQRLTRTGSWAFNGRNAVYWSEENFRIWGFDPQQGLPERETVLERIHPEDRDRVLECVQTAIREKTDYAVEFRIVLPGGTIRRVHGSGHPVFGASGELIEVVGTQLDVTERRRAEEERERLREAQADLAHINRVTTMGELTASLAHEINQPIAAAVTDANTCLRWLARDQPDLKEAREAASRVAKDAVRAADIIKRIRLLFGKAGPQRELLDVNEVVREMVVLLRSEATQSSVSVRMELPDLPQVVADRIQLQQVLMNLMINAIDAMKDVDGTRELIIRSQQSENGQLMVSISDTGVGLPLQQADQIFNAFFTTKPQGTGMGLRISRSIVESHGGRLWAADNSPRGASFHLTLPITVEAHE
jgi:PAS domain S-box-containing protein